MDRKALIALAVRVLANEGIIRQASPFEDIFAQVLGTETSDRRRAREIDASISKATEAVKRIKTNRKFKKIVEHV